MQSPVQGFTPCAFEYTDLVRFLAVAAANALAALGASSVAL